MAIIVNLTAALAVLVAFAALVIATRALRLHAGHAHAQPGTPEPHPARPRPDARNGRQTGPADQPTATRPAPATRQGNGGTQRGSHTREQVRAFLAQHSGQDWSLTQISNGVGRSSATVSYALDKLVEAGEVQQTSPKPRRWAITPSGASAAPGQTEPAQPAPTVPTTPEPDQADRDDHTTEAPAQAGAPAQQPPARKPTTRTSANGGTRRGDQTREQVRAFLAQRAGRDASLTEISNGVGRKSATVSYALDKLVEAGEVQQTSPRPRRWAVTGTVPTLIPDRADSPASEQDQTPADQPARRTPRGRRARRDQTATPPPAAPGGGTTRKPRARATGDSKPAAATIPPRTPATRRRRTRTAAATAAK